LINGENLNGNEKMIKMIETVTPYKAKLIKKDENGKTSPAEVWSALTNQAPSTAKENETEFTDKVKQ
jgi:hypothetical protein